jgi:hypothetical protein
VTVLAFDPGVTTGWAVLAPDGRILGTGNIVSTQNLREELKDVVRNAYLARHTVPEVIVEVFPLSPTGELAGVLREVVVTLAHVLVSYHIRPEQITPGVWKTSSVRQSEKEWNGQTLTQHQRDAIRMARYHLRRKDRKG